MSKNFEEFNKSENIKLEKNEEVLVEKEAKESTSLDLTKKKEMSAKQDAVALSEIRASLAPEKAKAKSDLQKYFQDYLELKEGDIERIELTKADDLPKNYQQQLESFNDQRLGNITIAVIPDDLWVKGNQPSESDAEKGLIAIKQSYFEAQEKQDEIAWLTHEFAHCQNLLDSKTTKNYENNMKTKAFTDLELEGTYPNNIVEQQAFTKQFKFLQEQGKSRKDVTKMISRYYDQEDSPFFDKLLDTVYGK